MRILILHMRYHPDPTGTGLVLTQMAERFAALGAEVLVITGHPHYGQHDHASARVPLLEKLDYNGVQLWRTWAYVPPNPSVFHRAISYLSYTALSVPAALSAGRFDVVLWMTPPITSGVVAWIKTLFSRTPVIFDLQDVWPDQVVRVGKLTNPFVIRLAEILEAFLYRDAARIRILSEAMRELLLSKGVPNDKLALIPNWVNASEITPWTAPHNPFADAHDLHGKFTVLFSGNIGYVAGLETVIDAAALLQDDPDILFLIVGRGNALPDLERQVGELELTNVRFLPLQPREDLPMMLAAADVCLVPLRKGLGGISVPSKMYTVMSAARPVLVADAAESDLTRLVADAGCGLRVPPSDPEAMAGAIRTMKASPAQLEAWGQAARAYVAANFDLDTLTRQYFGLIGDLVASTTRAR